MFDNNMMMHSVESAILPPRYVQPAFTLPILPPVPPQKHNDPMLELIRVPPDMIPFVTDPKFQSVLFNVSCNNIFWVMWPVFSYDLLLYAIDKASKWRKFYIAFCSWEWGKVILTM